jgi:hypothetical protein
MRQRSSSAWHWCKAAPTGMRCRGSSGHERHPSWTGAPRFSWAWPLRLDEMGAARDSFARAAERDPVIEIPARYYQGLTAYRGQHWDEARTQFTNVSARSPNTDMGRAAAEFLARMRAAPGGRRYRLYGEVGLQYDDNVQLSPGDESIRFIGPSRRADGRLTLLAGATYTVRPSDRIEISTAYEFSQSAHFHLSEFNLQGHRPSLQLAVNVQPVRFGVFGMYEFYLRQTDSYLSQGTVSPWVSVETAWGATEISVRLRRSDFLTQPEKGVLDAWNVAPGVRQYFYVDGPERYVFAGYRFENEDIIHATGEAFAFNAHDFSGGVGWGFPYDIRAQLVYDFRHQWYAAQSDGRRDDQHQVAVGISKPLNRYLMLTLGYFGAFNHSNQAAFRYNRNIGSVAIGVSF